MVDFDTIDGVAQELRKKFKPPRDPRGKEIKTILLFAYNGTGKTRLSMAFKDIGKADNADHLVTDSGDIILSEDGDALITETRADTLYFNAFTEDLFRWDNDLESDIERKLTLNTDSRFFKGLEDFEIENRIRPLLRGYVDFTFEIDPKSWEVSFSRTIDNPDYNEDDIESTQTRQIEETNIKVSRGEENLFIWCFFLAIAQLAMDKKIEAYNDIKYLYIDDPISSLDENNAVAVAHHLSNLLKKEDNPLKTIISTHHTLFFNVLYNAFNRDKTSKKFFFSHDDSTRQYSLKDTSETPFFYHVAMLSELHKVAQTGKLYTYHFNILRIILEKTASFHGYSGFSSCIKKDKDDEDGILHTRLINILSHGNYSVYEPIEMVKENRTYFKKILNDFLKNFNFNPELFPEIIEDTQQEMEE